MAKNGELAENPYLGEMTRDEAVAKLGRLATRMGLKRSALKVRRAVESAEGVTVAFVIDDVEIVRTCSSQTSADANLACLAIWLEDLLRNVDRGIETFRDAVYAEGGHALAKVTSVDRARKATDGANAYKGTTTIAEAREMISRSARRLGLAEDAVTVMTSSAGATVRLTTPGGTIEKSSRNQADARSNLVALALWLRARAKSFERGIERDQTRLFAAYLLTAGGTNR